MLEKNTKFCGKCGNNVAGLVDAEVENESSFFHENNFNLCEACGQNEALAHVVFYENRGAIVMRYHREIRGNFCKSCIDKYFWKYTLTTLCIGWLGVISLFIAPVYIINNVARYVWVKLN